MASGDLLTEVRTFLQETLAQEKLSEHAEDSRQQLITKLKKRDASSYIDMNGGFYCSPKNTHQCCNGYEEFNHSLEAHLKSKQVVTNGYDNNIYNNLSETEKEDFYANHDQNTQNLLHTRHPSEYDEDAYLKPSSPLANTPVIPSKLSLPTCNMSSNSNSQRNSIISSKKDSPDRNSDSSSFSGSLRCDESPEVMMISASAARCAATKAGKLGRREKMLFLEHTKFYWVALVNQMLFIFNTDKDCKPHCDLDITGYKARPVAISINNRPDFKFELVSPGRKTYQFIAEKQCDMDTWVSVLNSANKAIDPPKDWARQLPSLPHDTYDHPDNVTQPLLLSDPVEYELPDNFLRGSSKSLSSHSVPTQKLSRFTKITNESLPSESYIISKHTERRNTTQSCIGKFRSSPKETRRLPQPPNQQETYDQPETTIRPVVPQPQLYEILQEELYHCIEDQDHSSQPQKPKEMVRCLPPLPAEQEMYDQPDTTIRPVTKPQIDEEFYFSIDMDQSVPQEALYKNTEDTRNQDMETNYYNLVQYPETETEQECIYDVIAEQRQMQNPSPAKELSRKSIKTVDDTKKSSHSAKLSMVNAITEEIKLKFEEKKFESMSTIFNRSFIKPNLKEVKSPVVNKSYQ